MPLFIFVSVLYCVYINKALKLQYYNFSLLNLQFQDMGEKLSKIQKTNPQPTSIDTQTHNPSNAGNSSQSKSALYDSKAQPESTISSSSSTINATNLDKIPSQNKNTSNEIDEKKIGVPHIENQYWKMIRNGKTRSLTKAFQDQLVTCNQVIVPTSGHTIVHESIILDKREYFKLCQVYGANWDQGDANGVTALMKAVALNRSFYVEKLLELGADKQLKDNRGMTAQDYGQLYQSYDSLDILKQQQ